MDLFIMCASVLALVCRKKEQCDMVLASCSDLLATLELLGALNAPVLLCSFLQPSRCNWSVLYVSNSVYQANHSLESLSAHIS